MSGGSGPSALERRGFDLRPERPGRLLRPRRPKRGKNAAPALESMAKKKRAQAKSTEKERVIVGDN